MHSLQHAWKQDPHWSQFSNINCWKSVLCKLRVQLFITINLQILCKIQQGHSHLYISLAPFFYMIEGSCLQQGVINAPEIQNRSMMELKQSFYFHDFEVVISAVGC